MIPNYTLCRLQINGLRKKTGLLIGLLLVGLLSFAQSQVNYVEYYIDQDPGVNKGIPVTVTAGTSITNSSFNVSVSSLSTGIHMLGARARTASGVWGLTHFWFIFKPYPIVSTAALSNVTRVEYYIDKDPGIGTATAVTVTAGTDIQNILFNINPSTLGKGTHIIGARALSANGMWSQTNYWLFYNPFDNISPASISNISYAEYFVNQDPGLGKGLPLSISAAADVVNQSFNIALDTLKTGTNIVGIRARTANGLWSLTNYWLFVKPFAVTPAPQAAGNITAVEYYLDYDPGKGNAIPVTITAGTNLADISLNVDITDIIPGDHFVTIRARDINGKWSLVNTIKFAIPGTAPVLTTTFNNTAALCAGSNINIGYAITGAGFKSSNQFIAQLSDNSGSFSVPVNIGTVSSAVASGTISATIPAATAQGSGYRVRVISTNQSIAGANNGSNLTINPLPATPTITAGGSTAACSGTGVVLTSSANSGNQWLLNGTAISGAVNKTYTALAAGNYTVMSTVSSCASGVSSATAVTINPSPAAPTVTAGGPVSFCAGNSVVLTSGTVTGNQWLLNGSPIVGATAASYTASTTGSYTAVVAANGCTSTASTAIAITSNAIPATPSITTGGSTTVCSGTGVVLTSSAAAGNQWMLNGTAISGAVNKTYTALAAGNYTVMSTVSSCASAVSAATAVTINPSPAAPTVTAGGPVSFCAGNSVVLTSGTVTGNQWLLNGSPIVGATAASYTASTTGSYTAVVSANGCTSTASTAIAITSNAVPATPTITAGGSTTVCSGTGVVLTSSAATGNQWLLNGTAINGAVSKTYTATVAGNYTVMVTAGGCTGAVSNAITITVNDSPAEPTIASGGSTAICSGASVVLTSSATAGNQWFKDAVAITGASNTTYTVVNAGSYTLQVTNGSGCAAVSKATVITVGTNPVSATITAGGAVDFCSGGSVVLTSNAATGNQWLKDNVAINNATGVTYTVTESGKYSLLVTNAAGCSSNSANSITATVNALPAVPVITAGSATSFCSGGDVVLTSNAATNNQWFKDAVAISGATATTYKATGTGAYTVRVTNAAGCTATSIATAVTVNPLPAKPTVTRNGTDLVSSSAAGNQWYTDVALIAGATAATYRPSASGYYKTQVTVNGCVSPVSEPYYYLVSAITNIATVSGGNYTVLPNPVKDLLYIRAKNMVNRINVRISSIEGKTLIEKDFTGNIQVDVKNLAPGMYSVLLTDTKTHVQESKLIIKQ